MMSCEYCDGVKDSLLVIRSLLQHNDIKLEPKEFFKEFLNLIDEGVFPSHLSVDIKELMKGYKNGNNKSSTKN